MIENVDNQSEQNFPTYQSIQQDPLMQNSFQYTTQNKLMQNSLFASTTNRAFEISGGPSQSIPDSKLKGASKGKASDIDGLAGVST
jgi:hypothetical protein